MTSISTIITRHNSEDQPNSNPGEILDQITDLIQEIIEKDIGILTN